ncbi:uncharacterized protein B0T15DRAFT_574610 [Chaetomium strumarium]|uniref:Uncharacterized protein n=1 Tax=Chaetomium strumarium TaxID=1170767 RepID=A0AAJ0GS94_9PEZI|nr:hypothetical protein B0T15DRAFT_574610 [Chaetomium strumarium]
MSRLVISDYPAATASTTGGQTRTTSRRPTSTRSPANAISRTYEFGISATPVISGRTVWYPDQGTTRSSRWTTTTCTPQSTLNVTQLIHEYAPLTLKQGARRVIGLLFFSTQAYALVVAVNRQTGTVLVVNTNFQGAIAVQGRNGPEQIGVHDRLY